MVELIVQINVAKVILGNDESTLVEDDEVQSYVEHYQRVKS